MTRCSFISRRNFSTTCWAPHYHIEMQRRLRSAVEIELLPIAQLAASGEGKTGSTIDELVTDDLLPPGFGQHADGSRLVLDDGQLVDSLRGARGIVRAGSRHADRKGDARRSRRISTNSRSICRDGARMDPVVLGIRREELPGGKLERVVLDVQAAPLAPQHVEDAVRLAGRADPRSGWHRWKATSFVRGRRQRRRVFRGGGEHHLFGGLRNADPAIALAPTGTDRTDSATRSCRACKVISAPGRIPAI